jgi:hypothetical protein
MDMPAQRAAASALLLRPPDDQQVVILATLDEDGFQRACGKIANFADGECYDDWLDSRYAWIVGLCSSGVDAHAVQVDLSRFLAWRRLAGLAPSEEGLDEFAALVHLMRSESHAGVDLKALATVNELEFLAHFDSVEAFQRSGDYSSWVARRETAEQAALASGKAIVRTPTPIAAFLNWALCLGEGSSEALLDRYAFLALETFAEECR